MDEEKDSRNEANSRQATVTASADDEEDPLICTSSDDKLILDNEEKRQPLHLLLDAGYGVPRESRPRQEKILAIAKQIANFLQWQQQHAKSTTTGMAPVTVIGCEDECLKTALLQRLEILLDNASDFKQVTATTTKPPPDSDKNNACTENDNGNPPSSECTNNGDTDTPGSTRLLPIHFSFAKDPEHTAELLQDAVYLSPDAPVALNPSRHPPGKVIVGLLIDRRVQINRSLHRSEQMQLPAKRWPMEVVGGTSDDAFHPQEPLNVDTILEALQQWSWNCWDKNIGFEAEDDTAFLEASHQAFRHHVQRHPARPKHRPNS